LHRYKTVLKIEQAVMANREGEGAAPYHHQGSQNMATVAVLLDTLPAPSTVGVDKVYQQLKNILGPAAAQQVESSLQRQAEVSISTPSRSKARW
jgi:hypothetical protein